MAEGMRGRLRLARAERGQVAMEFMCLDELLSDDHRARQVWSYVEGLDLSPLYAGIESVEGRAGRPAIDPAILVSLWLYATLEDVGSARQLERLCQRDLAYRWIAGGVGVSHKTLSDFRVEAGKVLDDVLTRSIAALVASDIVDLKCLAVDGMRLRASAGINSFRQSKRLKELHELACQKVAKLRAELEEDPAASQHRRQERQLRAAQDRQRRIERAQQAEAAIAAQRAREAKEQRRKEPAKDKQQKEVKKQKERGPRASTTDAQARLMRMADGGFRPGFNVHLKTDVASGLVVGVSVDNNGSDRGRLEPTVEEIEHRYARRPHQLLADGGFDSKSDIEALHHPHNGAVEVFCPLPRTKDDELRPPSRNDGPGVLAWYQRMMSQEGEALYRRRWASERPHADMRNRGLTRVLVRGVEKVKAVVLWHVHAYNFLAITKLTRPA